MLEPELTESELVEIEQFNQLLKELTEGPFYRMLAFCFRDVDEMILLSWGRDHVFWIVNVIEDEKYEDCIDEETEYPTREKLEEFCPPRRVAAVFALDVKIPATIDNGRGEFDEVFSRLYPDRDVPDMVVEHNENVFDLFWSVDFEMSVEEFLEVQRNFVTLFNGNPRAVDFYCQVRLPSNLFFNQAPVASASLN